MSVFFSPDSPLKVSLLVYLVSSRGGIRKKDVSWSISFLLGTCIYLPTLSCLVLPFCLLLSCLSASYLGKVGTVYSKQVSIHNLFIQGIFKVPN